MQAYSEDLRSRIVAAVDGGMPRSEAARVFGVGRATVKRYLALRRATGALAPRPHRGPPPIVTAALAGIDQQSDLRRRFPSGVKDRLDANVSLTRQPREDNRAGHIGGRGRGRDQPA